MSDSVFSAVVWVMATSATAVSLAWTSPGLLRVGHEILLVAWLVFSNPR